MISLTVARDLFTQDSCKCSCSYIIYFMSPLSGTLWPIDVNMLRCYISSCTYPPPAELDDLLLFCRLPKLFIVYNYYLVMIIAGLYQVESLYLNLVFYPWLILVGICSHNVMLS